MRTSLVIHSAALGVLLLVPVQALHSRAPARKELDVVFHRAPQVEPPPPALPLPRATGPARALPGVERPELKASQPRLPAPGDPGKPDVPPGPSEGLPVVEAPPQQKVGDAGILAFRDKFANLRQDTAALRLGANARYTDSDEVGHASSGSMLGSNTPGSSGGINVASLSRSVGGGRGGNGGGPGGMPGMPVGRASSPIAGIGGGDRPLARNGPGPSRTDEEIQIVFDRYKASFYRLYNKELRIDPTLRGQMVLRLTIEPDGSVSMCVLQSTDMKAPELSAQVVSRVLTINFGAKEGVQALTIVYPIDFLPAA
jgi:hypothetical protein